METHVLVKRLFRILVVILAAGIGIAISAGCIEWYRLSNPAHVIPLGLLAATYIGSGLVFGFVGLLFSRRCAEYLVNKGQRVFQQFAQLPFPQFMSALLLMTAGLVVAALLTNILHFMGDSIFTTACSAILYVGLGTLGYTLGYVRSADFQQYIRSFFTLPKHTFHRKTHRAARKGASKGIPDKLLDSSALIDGRILALYKAGFFEGDLIIPDFIVEELHHIADSQDPSKRARGRRGLDTIAALQNLSSGHVRTMHEDSEDTVDSDVRLLRLSGDIGAVVITTDLNLTKIAGISGLPVLNLNELASILRPAVLPGERMTATVVKEGREANQGIAYTDDGTMIVIEDARNRIGETLALVVTSSLQTNAGRMIFAKPEE